MTNRIKHIPPGKVKSLHTDAASAAVASASNGTTIIDKNATYFGSTDPKLSEKYNLVPGIVSLDDPNIDRKYIVAGDMERLGTLYIVAPSGSSSSSDYQVFISVGAYTPRSGERTERVFKRLDHSSGVQKFVLADGTEVSPDSDGKLKLLAGPNMFIKEAPTGGITFSSTGGGTGGGITSVDATGSVTSSHSGTVVTLVGLGLTSIESDSGDSIPITANKVKAIVNIFAAKAQFKLGANDELQLDLPPIFTSITDGTTKFTPTEIIQEINFQKGEMTVPVVSSKDGSVQINVDAVAGISVGGQQVSLQNRMISLVAGTNIGMVVENGIITLSSSGGGSGGVSSLTTTGSISGNIQGETLSLDGSGLTSIKTDVGDVDVAANQITAKVSSYENKNEFVSGPKGELDLHLKPAIQSVSSGAKTFTPSQAVPGLKLDAGTGVSIDVDETAGSVTIGATSSPGGGGLEKLRADGKDVDPNPLTKAITLLAGDKFTKISASGSSIIFSNALAPVLDKNVYVIDQRQVQLAPVSFAYGKGEPVDIGRGKYYDIATARCNYCLYSNGICVLHMFVSITAKKMGEYKTIKGIVFEGFPLYGDSRISLQQGSADYQATDVRNIPYKSFTSFPELIEGGVSGKIYLGANSRYILYTFPRNIFKTSTMVYPEITTAYLSGNAVFWVEKTSEIPILPAALYDSPTDGIIISGKDETTQEDSFVYAQKVGYGFFVFGSTFPGYGSVYPKKEAWLDIEKYVGTETTSAMLNCYTENAYYGGSEKELSYGTFFLQRPQVTARLALQGMYTDGAKTYAKNVDLTYVDNGICSLESHFYGFYDDGNGPNTDAELIVDGKSTGFFATGTYREDSRYKGLGVCSIYFSLLDYKSPGGWVTISSESTNYDPPIADGNTGMMFGWFSDPEFKPPYVDVNATWGNIVMLGNDTYLCRGTRAVDNNTPMVLGTRAREGSSKGYWERYNLQPKTYKTFSMGIHGFYLNPKSCQKFLPSISGSVYGGSGAVKYKMRFGQYMAIDSNMILFSVVLRWSDFDGLGKLLITGFPFVISKTIRSGDGARTVSKFYHIAGRNMIGRAFPVDIQLRRSTPRVETLDSIVAVVYDEKSIMLRSTRTVDIPSALSFYFIFKGLEFAYKDSPQILREDLLMGPPTQQHITDSFDVAPTGQSDAGTITCQSVDVTLLVFYASITRFLEEGPKSAGIWFQEGGGTIPDRNDSPYLGNVNYSFPSKGPLGSVDLLCASTVKDGLQVAAWVDSGYSILKEIPAGECSGIVSSYMVNLPIKQSVFANAKNTSYKVDDDNPVTHSYTNIVAPATGSLTFDGSVLENISNGPVFIMVQVITRSDDAKNVELNVDIFSKVSGYKADFTSSGVLLEDGLQTGTTLLHFLPLVPGDQVKINQRWGESDITCDSESISIIEFDVNADFYADGIIDGWVPATYGRMLLDFSRARVTNLSGLKCGLNRVTYNGPGSILLFVSAYVPVVRPATGDHSFAFGAKMYKYENEARETAFTIQERSSADSSIEHRVFLSFIVEIGNRDYLEFYFDNFADNDTDAAYNYDDGFYSFTRLDGNFGSPLSSKGYATTYADVDASAILGADEPNPLNNADLFVTGMLPIDKEIIPDSVDNVWVGNIVDTNIPSKISYEELISSKSIALKDTSIFVYSKPDKVLVVTSAYTINQFGVGVSPGDVKGWTEIPSIIKAPEAGSVIEVKAGLPDPFYKKYISNNLTVLLLDAKIISEITYTGTFPYNISIPVRFGANQDFISGNSLVNTTSESMFAIISIGRSYVSGYRSEKFVYTLFASGKSYITGYDRNVAQLIRLEPGERLSYTLLNKATQTVMLVTSRIAILPRMNDHLDKIVSASYRVEKNNPGVFVQEFNEIPNLSLSSDGKVFTYSGEPLILIWVQIISGSLEAAPFKLKGPDESGKYSRFCSHSYVAILKAGETAAATGNNECHFTITKLSYKENLPQASPAPPEDEIEDVIEREPTGRERELSKIWEKRSAD